MRGDGSWDELNIANEILFAKENYTCPLAEHKAFLFLV